MSIDGYEGLYPSYGDDNSDYLYKRSSHFKDAAKRLSNAKLRLAEKKKSLHSADIKGFSDKIFAEQKKHKAYADEFIKDLLGSDEKSSKIKKGNKMAIEQFLTLDIGSNKATIDLSQVRKQGLVFEKTMFGKKPKIMIFYKDRPDTPEVNFELNSEEEARSVYNNITKKLDRWAEESNSARLQILQQELEIMREQKEAQKEEIDVLMQVFNQFKEMMQIMEDDTKTSSLVETIKKM